MATISNAPLRPVLASHWLRLAVLCILFGAGLGIRLVDLTDPPLDFHPTRQLRSANIARDLYYRSLPAAEDWQRKHSERNLRNYALIEPLVFETLVAFTYRVIGAAPLWVPRLYAIFFWLIGGIGLYNLAKALTSADGGTIALAYYLFVPFGVIASRSFQPDPLMIMLICLALWAIYRWYERPGWQAALLAGSLVGMALLIKAVALFFVLPPLGALLLFGVGLRRAWRNRQVWAIGFLAVLPVIAYHLYGVYIHGEMESQFSGRFFPGMWNDPLFYVHWIGEMSRYAGYGALLLGLLGMFLFRAPVQRVLTAGLWLGYGLYGFTFPYHILTHSYYHLPLLPIVGLSLASGADLMLQQLASLRPVWFARLLFIGLLLFGVFGKAWEARADLLREDFRSEPAYWETIAAKLGRDSSIVALTDDYGNRLAYFGWITARVWLPSKHLENYRELRGGMPLDVDQTFAELTGSADFFLVTKMNQLDQQEELKDLLVHNYAIYAEGDGYLVFDLRSLQPKP